VAEYNVDIQVRAKTQQVESQLTKLQQRLDQLAGAAARIDFGTPERVLRRVGNTARTVGTEVRNVFSRGLFAGAVLGAGQLSTSITDVINKFGFLGKSAASSINSSLGGVPELVGNILNQIGHIPNAMGLAAVAAMAFAPQLLKASSAAVGLGAAVDKAVGKQVTENIAGVIGQVNGLKTAVDNTKTSFADLIKGSTLNQLNAQLKDARHQIGEYHSSTQQAVTAASQLVSVIRAQAVEQRAINDLVRQAKGITQSELEETKAVKSLATSRERAKYLKKEAEAAQEALAAIRTLEQAESSAARTRLAAKAKEKADALREQALAAQQALDATRSLEQAESSAARSRLAAQVQEKRRRDEFLAGGQISPFPFGPQPRSTRRRFEGDVSPERAEAALRAKELREQRAENKKVFEEEKNQLIQVDRLRAENARKQTARIAAISKRIKGSLSSAAIGGAFPLLFGQSPQAAVGGAIGGLLGGPAGGFAGSLIGTALGAIEAAKATVKELSAELGFSSTQAQTLSAAFELAGRNSQQLEAAVVNIQGLGLSTTETASAIKIAVELSKEYGGSVDKVAQAFADTLESGKVSITTLNKFTAQGIPIQDELANKFGVSRSKLLEMAKDGEVSVQQLTNALVDMGRRAENTADKGATGFDRFTKAVKEISSAISEAAGALLSTLVPALDTVLSKLAQIITRATKAIQLITDKTVGEAATAVSASAAFRGTGFASKTNIDGITKGLSTLNPKLAQTAEDLSKIEQVAANAQVELGKYTGKLGEYSVQTAQLELTRVKKDIAARRATLGAPQRPRGIESINAPSQLTPSGGTSAKALATLEKRINKLKEEAALTMRTAEIKAKIRQAEIAGDSQLVLRLKYEEARAKIISNTEKALVGTKDLREQDSLVIARNAELYALVRDYEYDIVDLQRQSADILPDTLNRIQGLASGYSSVLEYSQRFTKEQEQQKQMADGLANAIGQGMAGAFDDLILGTEAFGDSLRRIASGVLTDIARQLLQIYVINQAINAISNIFSPTPGGAAADVKFNPAAFAMPQLAGARANGGSVSAGSSYLVGERGPELFVPGASGNIVPNNAMGSSNIVVNVDATGSSVQGNGDESKRLGEAIGIAIRQELIKQKRPGGLLA
jgi:tape measure domain-containing protein